MPWMNSSAGPNPNKKVNMGFCSCSVGRALISTWWSMRNCSRPRSTNAGSVVPNDRAVCGAPRSGFGNVSFSPGGGHVTAFLNRPVSVSPRL